MLIASRDLVLLRLRHPLLRQLSERHQNPDPRLPARLLHGRAGLADRVRRHAVRVRAGSKTTSTANSASPKKTEGDQIMATQTAAADAFYKQLGRMYGTYTGGFIAFVVLLAILEYLGVPNQSDRLSVRVLHARGLRHHRRDDADGASFPNTTSPAAACRPSTTAWRPAPTGCRRRASSAWPARCSCSAMTASPGCSAGPAASCWCRS